MAPHTVYRMQATGEEIQDIIKIKLAPAIDGEPMSIAILGMISLSILLMKPDITLERLQECLDGVSGYIITYLVSLGDPEPIIGAPPTPEIRH